MASQRLSVLEIILENAYRTWRTSSNPRSKYTMKCPLCEYDSRSGTNYYFTVHEDENLWSCQVCGAGGNAQQLQQLLTGGHTYVAPEFPPEPSRQKNADGEAPPLLQGVTIAELAKDKGLDADWLRDFLLWRDTRYLRHTPAIEIPYPDENNANPLTRYRVGLDQGDRFRWKRFGQGQHQIPYGLWCLQYARDYGYINLVEGETDFATLLYNEIPVLGIPGANSFGQSWAKKYLAGIGKIFVFQEPDKGGETLLSKILPQINGAYVIQAPEGAKDPNELYKQLGVQFKTKYAEMMDQAVWTEDTSAAAKEPDYWPGADLPEAGEEDGITSRDANLRREMVMDAYYGIGEAEAATRVKFCALWKRAHSYECGTIVGKSYHCGKKGCPNCTSIRLGQFFEEKEELLAKELQEPAIFTFEDLVRRRLEVDDLEVNEEVLARGYDQMRELLGSLTKTLGKEFKLARDHIYGMLCRCRDDVANFGITFLGNKEDNDLKKLESFFSKELGREVKGRRYVGSRRNMVWFFSYLVADAFDWEKAGQFQAWVRTQKGRKMVQGKGVFSSVSGSKPAKQEPTSTELCPVHGIQEAVYHTKQIGPPGIWVEYDSPHLSRRVYLLAEGCEMQLVDMESELRWRDRDYG